MTNFAHGGYGQQLPNKERIIDFSANINPLGMPKTLIESIKNSIPDLIYYPDVNYLKLRKNLAEYYHYDANKIWVGNGSVDLLFNVIEIIKSENALLLAPSFGEYERAFVKSDAHVNLYYLDEKNEFRLDVNDFIAYLKSHHEIDCICLANPNNPTGALLNRYEFRQLVNYCNDNGIWLILDEAFMDFIPEQKQYSFVPELASDDSVVIIKSLTKYFAIPGLRLGMALFPNQQFVNTMIDYAEPWAVNTFAAGLGSEVFHDREFQLQTANWLSAEKNYLEKSFAQFKYLKVYPSTVNYYLIHCPQIDLYDKLLQQNILIRNCNNYHGLTDGFYRVAVRSHHDNQQLIQSIGSILAGVGE